MLTRNDLSVLAPDVRAEALEALDLANKITGYWQELARTKQPKPEPEFTPEEKKIYRAINAYMARTVSQESMPAWKKAGLRALSGYYNLRTNAADRRKAVIACKLFMGEQMDFYRENPDLMDIFKDISTRSQAEAAFDRVDLLVESLPESIPMVDSYCAGAHARLKGARERLLSAAGFEPS